MRKLSLILAIVLIASSLGCVQAGIAFAASETTYSGVLADLQKDELFDVKNYPGKEKTDKPFDVFQIAESTENELFVYVYQPLQKKYTASEIRISTTVGENLDPHDYPLKLLDQADTLAKYKVEGLTVKSDAVRYYFILQIARPFNKDEDTSDNGDDDVITGSTQSDDIHKTVPFPIGKQFTACTLNGVITYTMEYQEYIFITDKRLGYLRYTETSPFLSMLGCGTVGETLDSHYVAFTTDKPIDKLLEIQISYRTVLHHKDILYGILNEYDDAAQSFDKTYLADNYADVDVFYKSYKWKRIQSVSEFISTEPSLTDKAKEKIKDMTWVLRFLETKVTTSKNTPLITYNSYTRAEEVTILRLKFDLQGKTYNLGVVDGKQSEGPNQKPDNEKEFIEQLEKFFKDLGAKFNKFWEWLQENWWVLVVVVIVVLLIVSLCVRVLREGLWTALQAVGKVLWAFVKYLAIGLFYIVTCPYWIVRAIVLAVKNRKGG